MCGKYNEPCIHATIGGGCCVPSACRHVSKMTTKGDKIRHMTDEELAEDIVSFCGADLACDCCKPTMRIPGKCDGRCRAGVLAWLQQPVSE